jgi:hypothetical protein
MGQSPNADDVRSEISQSPNPLNRHIPREFNDGATFDARDGSSCLLIVEIVEKKNIRSCLQGFVHFCHVGDLDFDARSVRSVLSRRPHSLCDAAASRDVIVFDHDGGTQAISVIASATIANGAPFQ